MTFTWLDGPGMPHNLTGFTAKMQVRDKPGGTNLILDIPSPNGALTLGGVNGTIRLQLSDTETASATSGVYDILLTDGGGVVSRLLEGELTVDEGVTT